MKKCKKCSVIKPKDCFSKVKRNKDGLNGTCKDCIKETLYNQRELCSICGELKQVQQRINDVPICPLCYKKHILKKRKCCECGFYKIIDYKEYGLCGSCYRKLYSNKQCNDCGRTGRTIGGLCRNCDFNLKYNNDENFRLKFLLRTNFGRAVRNSQSNKKIKIEYKKILDYIGPCPGKREDYHIDHVFPLSAFDFSKKFDQMVAFSPENHQWLLKNDNLKKSNKYNLNELNNFKMKFKE
jgi:hypothetical protein